MARTSSLSRGVQQESTSRQGSVIQGQKLGKRLAFLFLFAVLLAGAVAASLLFGSNNLPPFWLFLMALLLSRRRRL